MFNLWGFYGLPTQHTTKTYNKLLVSCEEILTACFCLKYEMIITPRKKGEGFMIKPSNL